MYRLTDRRLQQATDILERYRDQLLKTFQFDAMRLDRELQTCWNVGYQELKSIFMDMLKNEHYRHVAIFYMENVNNPVVVSEFQSPLAKVYGIRYYHAPERKQKQEEFWASFREGVARGETP